MRAAQTAAAKTSCHLGLRYYRLVDTWSETDGDVRHGTERHWSIDGQAKTEFLKRVIALNKELQKGMGAALLANAHCRQDRLLASLTEQGYATGTISLKTTWRFVSGLGIRHPFETGFSVSRTIGVPYLPGSSVKGATLDWAEADEPPSVDDAFGSPTHVGAVTFFDALPVSWPTIEMDIVNPHYADYYEGTAPPADWLSPRPVHFLTIAPSQPFKFAVAVRPARSEGDPDPSTMLTTVLSLIRGAAAGGGFGGKTSVGYGFLE